MSSRSPERADPVLLSGGRALGHWIEAGGSPQRPVKLLRARLVWNAYWFERHFAWMEQYCCGTVLPSDPVFIVGLWRTGSTLLHQRLADATGWTTPRTWQCFAPAAFPLAPRPANRIARRPMDAGSITTFSPQEDEFAALLLGEESLYRSFIDPRRIAEIGALCGKWHASAAPLDAALSPRWQVFLRAVLHAKPGRLLLKSPNHTFRVPWLAERFPNAQFVWLRRPAADVNASAVRMWESMISRYALWNPTPGEVEGFVRHAIRSHDDVLDWARGALPDRIHLVDFATLLNDDGSVVTRLIEALGPRDTDAVARVA